MRASLSPALLVVMLIFLYAPSSAVAGPWTPDRGTGYVKLGLAWLPGFLYQPGPEAAESGVAGPQPYGLYQQLSLVGYAELGVAEGVALSLHWDPVRFVALGDPRPGQATRTHLTVGEPELGGRLRLLRWKRLVWSLEGGIRAPMQAGGPVQGVYGTAEGNPRIGSLRVASEVWDFRAGTAVGLGLDSLYLAASLGAVFRTDDYDSLLCWAVELGKPIGKKELWQARVRVAGQHALGDGSAPYHSSPSGIGNGTTFVAFTIEVERQLGPESWLGVSLGGGLVPVVRQTGGPALSLYFARTF